MNDRSPSREWLSSSDWDSVVGRDGGYFLGVGYCYVSQLSNFFKRKGLHYHFFETKWGRCGTTFLFSALRPDNIIILSAWGNASAICGSNKTLFRIWKSILLDLSRIGVPIMMVEMPAAWHLSNLAVKVGSDLEDRVATTRRLYFEEVVRPVENSIEYIDLANYVCAESKIIRENTDGTVRDESPWHIRQEALDCVGEVFLEFCAARYNRDDFVDKILFLEGSL